MGIRKKRDKRQGGSADIGRQAAPIGRLFAGFGLFLKKYRGQAVCIGVILTLLYGRQAFTDYFYIDKEVFVNNPGSYYNWGETGRFGLILLNKIFGMGWYNPYVGGILFLLGSWLSAMAFGYLFYTIEPQLSPGALFASMLLFMVYPTYIELFLFQFVAYLILAAMALLLVADWLFVLAVREKNRIAFALSLPLTVIAFGSYQSLMLLQLCFCMGIFLIIVYTERDKKMTGAAIGCSAAHFILAFGISEGISRCFFSGSDYVSNMVAWQLGDYESCLNAIKGTLFKVVFQRDVCHPLTYDLCWGMGLITLFVLLRRQALKKAVWYGLGLLGVVLSPFFLLFVMGQPPMYRTLMTFPAACAILFLFSAHVLSDQTGEKRRKFAGAFFAVCGCIMLFLNCKPMMRLYYTRDIVGKADEMTAGQILEKLDGIQAVEEEAKPVVFIGHRPAMTNASCYTLRDCFTYTILSVFEMDYSFEPYYYYSTHRILGFYRTLGVQYLSGPKPEHMPAAYKDSEAMPVWPREGSVEEFDDYVIVKLGETVVPAVFEY